MTSRAYLIFVVGVLALTMTGCSDTSQNTNACRELLNIEGELSTLVNDTSATDDEQLADYLALADAAKSLDAEGEVETVAMTLGNVAQDFHDALEAMAQDRSLAGPVDSAILKSYIDTSIDMREVCEPFLP